MNIKKAVLIEPRSPGINFFSYTKMPLLGLPILGAVLRNMGLKVKIFCENIAPVDWEEIKTADLVGITVLTNLAPRAYEIIQRVKEINPRCRVVMGGPHVSFCPEEALEKGSDFVVRHEGEKTLQRLVTVLRNDDHPQKVKGLSYKEDGSYYHTPDLETYQDLDRLPEPDFSLIKGVQKLKFIMVQTSRGWSHNCEFCSVVQMFGRKIRYRSPDKVL